MNQSTTSRRIQRPIFSQHSWISAVDATRASVLQNRVASTSVTNPMMPSPANLMAWTHVYGSESTR
jgi:hypothetical protein